jgi:hypothetical protein
MGGLLPVWSVLSRWSLVVGEMEATEVKRLSFHAPGVPPGSNRIIPFSLLIFFSSTVADATWTVFELESVD